ncbi:MAG: cysteine hydrolase [Thermoleophilia bacterium]|nr:cysteine hydrolase [Thermoleophilia bacterium]
MSTFPDRPNSALLVIDVQEGVVAEAHARDQVVANVATLVDRARAAGTPVVWVQHEEEPHLPRDSDAWRIVPELEPRADEPVVAKGYGDSFEATRLEEVLAELGVGRLFIAGAQADQCIRGTLHGALVRGYDTWLVSDAHTTEDQSEYGAPPPEQVIAHTNLYWQYESSPGREVGTVDTRSASFGA